MLSDVFSSHRPLLFSIAYRMLGSASDAEDVVQDAWLRYSDVDPPTIRSPKALATTAATCRIGHTRVSRVTGKAVTRGRAVFLLKDIFEYGHSEVAEMLGLTVENSRQLLHRAKARLAEPRPQPALIIRVDERLESIFVFSIDGETVSGIRVVRNPDKLPHIDRRLTTH